MELLYDPIYHQRCQLKLRSGRTILLESLDQQMTYVRLLIGNPCAESNDFRIGHITREAQRYCVSGAKPHLIPPVRRDYFREPGDMRRAIERSPHHIPEWLPMVRCIGSFSAVVNPPFLSVLTVVWFQDEYALPILEPALGQLLAIDWDSLATDFEL